MVVPGMSYWDAYLLPVQIRKYMINTHLRIQNQVQERRENPKAGMQALAQRADSSIPKPNFLSKPQR